MTTIFRPVAFGLLALAATFTAAAPPASLGTIHLVITGGKHAGTYDAVMREGGASYGLAGPGQFGNQYSITTKKPNELSGVQLVVNDVKGSKTTSSGFVATVMFGPFLGGETLDINTQADASRPTGQGQLTLKYGGGKGPATVHLLGETAAHEKIDLTINATTVMTAS